MAYLKKEDLVIINGTGDKRTIAVVTDIEFRRFKKNYKDKKTGETRYKLKSVPYAVCTISSSPKFSTGSKMVIAGYKLRNHVMNSEKCLILENQYIAKFEEKGESWVKKLLDENKKKNEKK